VSRRQTQLTPPARTAGRLLLVALNHVRRPHIGGVGIATRFPQRSAPAQQVPALVERDRHLSEAPAIGVRRLARRLAFPQLVLFRDELLDRSVDLNVVQ
jgi:hypothetical protein